MFVTRLISGILFILVALFTIISGGYVLFFTLFAISLIGMDELMRAMKIREKKHLCSGNCRLLGATMYYVAVLLDFERYGFMAVIASLVLLMFVYVFTYPKFRAQQIMAVFFSVVYVAVMLSLYLSHTKSGGRPFSGMADFPVLLGL